MSEFGATSNVDYLEQATSYARTLGLSWIYWAWKYYQDPTGSSDEPLELTNGQLALSVIPLSQPYAQAIAGTPISATFQQSGAIYQLVYRPSAQIQAPTSVFVAAAVQYGDGYCSRVSGGQITSPPGASHLLVKADAKATKVVVTIQASSCALQPLSPAPTAPPPSPGTSTTIP